MAAQNLQSHRSVFTNPQAARWEFNPGPSATSRIRHFHNSLPGFHITPLIPLADEARSLGVRAVFVKDESSRMADLPAFKILGASWGTYCAVAERCGLSVDADVAEDVVDLAQLGGLARGHGVRLFAATDGNHGRAVARMGKLLKLDVRVFVPAFTDGETRDKIASEGAEVVQVPGDYNFAVETAYQASEAPGTGGLLIQDMAFEGYEVTAARTVDGYATMLAEIEEQLAVMELRGPVVIVAPVGAGSLAQAVVTFCKFPGRAISVLAIEPTTSACLNASLKAGAMTTITTSTTIMDGMNCPSVSPIAWPLLREGVDASVTLSDVECHAAVQYLQSHGVNAGPCGAAPLAGLRNFVSEQDSLHGDSLRLTHETVVVLLCTEGKRGYQIPR